MKDKQGREFDAKIHKTNEDGTPVEKDGYLVCLMGKARQNPQGRSEEQKKRERNRKRGVFGRDLRLDDRDPKPGFVRRWVNDIDGRIRRLSEQDDYQVVKVNGKVDRRGVGNGAEAVLMEIPNTKEQPWYDENQEDKKKLIVDPGKMRENQIGEGEYSPRGREKAIEDDPLR